MAMRVSPSRRLVGNPLGGVLRHLDQRARIAGRTRTTSLPDETDPPPPPAPAAAAPRAVSGGPMAAVVETGEDGRARWTYPAAYGAPPVVSALAVDPDPGDEERMFLVTLEEVTAWCVTVRVWRTRPRRGSGVVEPAGAGVRVHVMAAAVGSAHG